MSNEELRKYYIGVAMQGILSNPNESDPSASYVKHVLGLPNDTNYVHQTHHPKFIAALSVLYADALIEELNNKTK